MRKSVTKNRNYKSIAISKSERTNINFKFKIMRKENLEILTLTGHIDIMQRKERVNELSLSSKKDERRARRARIT